MLVPFLAESVGMAECGLSAWNLTWPSSGPSKSVQYLGLFSTSVLMILQGDTKANLLAREEDVAFSFLKNLNFSADHNISLYEGSQDVRHDSNAESYTQD